MGRPKEASWSGSGLARDAHWLSAASRWYASGDKLLVAGDGCALALSGWPSCRAWRRDPELGWTPHRPTAPVLRLLPRHDAAARLLSSFPRAVRARVSRLPERHWLVLALLARFAGAGELFETNPALAFALASNSAFRERRLALSTRAVTKLLANKRTVMAEWLGFPAKPSAVRVLGKVVPRAVSIRTLLFLRETLLWGEVPKPLLHLPELDEGVLRIATDPELARLASYSLLRDVAEEEPHDSPAATLLRDAADMHATLRGRPLPAQQSLAGLRRIHEELAAEVSARATLDALRLELPSPPLAGTSTIVPLSTPAALLAEGRAMHHCAFGYAGSVARGARYVYRVLEPERATLSLVKRGRAWTLGELAGPSNRAVSDETRARVVDWFESSVINARTSLPRPGAGPREPRPCAA